MKKDYILITAGIIPLLFSIFVLNFFLKDDRKDLFESATLLDGKTNSKLEIGQLVKFSGVISEKNLKVRDDYVLAVQEKFVKSQNGKRSEWVKNEFFLQPINVEIDGFSGIQVLVSNNYLPCGDGVKISENEPKKSRVLGIVAGLHVSAVGQILSLDPLEIQTGYSLCTGTIENYKDYLNKKWLGYLFILICISIPSIGLIYLGLFKVRGN